MTDHSVSPDPANPRELKIGPALPSALRAALIDALAFALDPTAYDQSRRTDRKSGNTAHEWDRIAAGTVEQAAGFVDVMLERESLRAALQASPAPEGLRASRVVDTLIDGGFIDPVLDGKAMDCIEHLFAAPPSEALDTQLRTARTVWEEALRMVKAKQAELLIRPDDPDPEDALREVADDLAARLQSTEEPR